MRIALHVGPGEVTAEPGPGAPGWGGVGASRLQIGNGQAEQRASRAKPLERELGGSRVGLSPGELEVDCIPSVLCKSLAYGWCFLKRLKSQLKGHSCFISIEIFFLRPEISW